MSELTNAPESPRRYLLPERFREQPVFEAFAEALDAVLKEQVDDPSLLFLDLRDVHRESDRYVMSHTADMLGITKQAAYLDDDRVRKLLKHLPRFRSENSTEAYQNFIGFLVNYPLGIDYLWTDDYFAFFSLPYGDTLIDDLGNRLEDDTRGWYNTTHVLIRANARAIFPDAVDPYREMKELFYSIAPAYLVLEFIGNILPPYETEMELNLGVVDGFATETYSFNYEIPNLSTSDWQQGRNLPAPQLVYHGQSNVNEGTVFISGGYAGDSRNEDLTFYVKRSSSRFQNIEHVPFDDSIITALAYAPNLTTVVAGTSTGEMACTFDSGRTWKKIWSPFFNDKVPIVDIVFAKQYGTFMAMGYDGTSVLAEDPENWNTAPVRLPTKVNALLFNAGVYVALCNAMTLYWSLDGKTWKKEIVSTTGTSDNLYCGTFDEQLNQWFVAGSCGRVFLSINLLEWVEFNSGFGDYAIRSCDYSIKHGIYIIGGENASVAVSADAKTWFLRDVYFRTEDVAKVAYLEGSEQFVAFGAAGSYAASSDAYNWHLYPNPLSGPASVTVANSILYIREGGQTLIGGNGPSICIATVSERHLRGPDLPARSAKHTQVDLEGEGILVVGGQSGTTVYDTTLSLNPVTKVWETKAAHPTPVKEAAGYLIPKRTSGQVWTPRNPRFGHFHVAQVKWLPKQQKYLAVGQQSRVSVSDYGINWGLLDAPFCAQHLVAATYSANGDIVVCANNQPVPKTVFIGASLRSTDLAWYEIDPSFDPLVKAADFKYIKAGQFKIMLAAQFDEAMSAVETVVNPDGTTTTKPNYISAVSATDTMKFQTVTMPVAEDVLNRSVFCGIYVDDFDAWILGTVGGFLISRSGAAFEFVELAVDEEWDAGLPLVAIGYDNHGTLLAMTADGQLHTSVDSGRNWWRSNESSNNPNLFNLYSVEGFMRFHYYDWTNDPKASTMVCPVDILWIPYEERWYVAIDADEDQTGTNCIYAPDTWGYDAVQIELDNVPYGSSRNYRNRRFCVVNVYESWISSELGYSPIDTERVAVIFDGLGVHVFNYDSNYLNDTHTSRYVDFSGSVFWQPKYNERGLTCGTSVTIYDTADPTLVRGHDFLVGGSWLWRIACNYSFDNLKTPDRQRIPVNLKAIPQKSIGWTYVAGDLPELDARYAVTVYDDYGDSDPVFLTVPVPDSTEGVGISITWQAVRGARGYRVWGREAAGQLRLLADLPPSDTNYVDTGETAPGATLLPEKNTSGLSRFVNEIGEGLGLEIEDLQFIRSMEMYILATVRGRIAYSYDGYNWFGVVNPAVQLMANKLIVKEDDNFWTCVGNEGFLATSRSWNSYWETRQDPANGSFKTICYDSEKRRALVGGTGSKLMVSEHTLMASPGNFNRDWYTLSINPHHIAAPSAGINVVDYVTLYLIGFLEDGSSTNRTPLAINWFAADPDAIVSFGFALPEDQRIVGYEVRCVPDTDITTTDHFVMGRVTLNYDLDGWQSVYLFDSTNGPVQFISSSSGINLDTTSVTGDRIATVYITIITVAGVELVRTFVDGELVSEVSVSDGGKTGSVLGIQYHLSGSMPAADVDKNVPAGWTFSVMQAPWQNIGAQDNAVFYNDTFRRIGESWQTLDTGLGVFNANHLSIHTSGPGGADRKYVAVGNGGFIGYSDDTARNWRQTLIHENVVGTTNLLTAAHASIGGANVTVVGGQNRFLASTQNLFTTPLGKSLDHGLPSDVTDIRYVPAPDSRFLAVGKDSGLCDSVDGFSWNTHSVEYVTDFSKITLSGSNQYKVTVTGTFGTLVTGFSVSTLLKRPTNIGSGDVAAVISEYTGNHIVLAGQGKRVSYATSFSGPWLEAELPADDGSGPVKLLPMNRIICGVFDPVSKTGLLFGNNGYAYKSANMEEWNILPQYETKLKSLSTDGVYTHFPDLMCCAVNPANGTVMVGTATGDIYRLTAGSPVGWVKAGKPDLVTVNGIAFGSNVWVAVSNDGKIRRSADNGKTWTSVNVSTPPFSVRRATLDGRGAGDQWVDFTSVAYGNGAFIVTGDEGDVLMSEDLANSFVLKESRMNGTRANTSAFGGNTYLIAGNAGSLRTSFTGFEESVLICGGATTANGAAVATTRTYSQATNTWATTAPMNNARRNHGIAGFEDGTALVMGGVDNTDAPLVSSERWLPHRGVWAMDIDMPYAKGYVRAARTKGGAIIATGSGPDPYHSALVYLPANVAPAPPVLTVGVGFLPPGEYWYRLSVATVSGETLPTKPIRIRLAETAGVILDWEPVDNAVEYRIYGRGANADELVQVIPGHLTSYNDLGVSNAPAGTFVRQDNSADGWFEIDGELPLPREGHGFSMLAQDLMISTGGYSDNRTWRLTVNPYNFVRAQSQVDLLDPDKSYVDRFYVDNGAVEDQDDNYVTPNQ